MCPPPARAPPRATVVFLAVCQARALGYMPSVESALQAAKQQRDRQAHSKPHAPRLERRTIKGEGDGCRWIESCLLSAMESCCCCCCAAIATAARRGVNSCFGFCTWRHCFWYKETDASLKRIKLKQPTRVRLTRSVESFAAAARQKSQQASASLVCKSACGSAMRSSGVVNGTRDAPIATTIWEMPQHGSGGNGVTGSGGGDGGQHRQHRLATKAQTGTDQSRRRLRLHQEPPRVAQAATRAMQTRAQAQAVRASKRRARAAAEEQWRDGHWRAPIKKQGAHRREPQRLAAHATAPGFDVSSDTPPHDEIDQCDDAAGAEAPPGVAQGPATPLAVPLEPEPEPEPEVGAGWGGPMEPADSEDDEPSMVEAEEEEVGGVEAWNESGIVASAGAELGLTAEEDALLNAECQSAENHPGMSRRERRAQSMGESGDGANGWLWSTGGGRRWAAAQARSFGITTRRALGRSTRPACM